MLQTVPTVSSACCLCLQLFLQLYLAVSSLLGEFGREDGLGVLTVGSWAGATPERRRETPRLISRRYGVCEGMMCVPVLVHAPILKPVPVHALFPQADA